MLLNRLKFHKFIFHLFFYSHYFQQKLGPTALFNYDSRPHRNSKREKCLCDGIINYAHIYAIYSFSS